MAGAGWDGMIRDGMGWDGSCSNYTCYLAPLPASYLPPPHHCQPHRGVCGFTVARAENCSVPRPAPITIRMIGGIYIWC